MSSDSFERKVILVEDDLRVFFTPHSGQKKVLTALLFRMLAFVFVQCGRKFGKALKLDTPILTPDGFILIGDIVAGDVVYDEKGQTQHVIIAHDVIDEPESYRIHFDDGTHIDACGDHQWLTWTKSDRKNSQRGLSFNPSVKSTLELYETQMCGKEYNHSIPMTEPVNFNKNNLPIDPYVFGCWIGDGHTHGGEITTMDDEIVMAFAEYIPTPQKYQNAGKAITYGTIGLHSKLRELGVLGRKNIPDIYLMSSIENRIALVQGIMDTDGTISNSGNSCEIIQKHEHLIDSISFLLCSLGMKPRKTVRIINGVNYYRLIFRPRMQVFRINRKACKYVPPKKPFDGHRTIQKVERIESTPMRCLTVSGESSLFLAGYNLVPTHNTDLAIYCCYWFAMMFDGCEVYYAADTQKHARELVWTNQRLQNFLKRVKRKKGESKEDWDIRKKKGLEIHAKWIDKINSSEMKIYLTNGSFIGVEGAENFANADGLEPQFMVYDEFKHHDPRFNEAMEPNMDVYNGSILSIGTPPDNEDNYYCKVAADCRRRDDAAFFKMPSYLNEVVYPDGENGAKFQKIIKKYTDRGEWDVLRREYYGDIVQGGSSSIFPMFEPLKVDDFGKVRGFSKHVRSYDELILDIKRYPKDWEFYVSADPATSSVFAVLFTAIHRRSKAVVCIDEIYETERRETSTYKIFPRILEKMREFPITYDDWNIVYDYAEAWFANEVAVGFDFALMPCEKDLKNKEKKLGQIKDLINSGLFYMSDRCIKTSWEMSNYCTDKNGKIPKINDHNIDNLRYTLNAAAYDFHQLAPPEEVDPDEVERYTIENDPIHDEHLDEWDILSGEFYE